MFGSTQPVRRGSVTIAGLLLAALISGVNLAAPAAATAQSSDKALLARFEAGSASAVIRSTDDRASRAPAPFPCAERALLGYLGKRGAQARKAGTEGGAISARAPVAAERALLGRRSRATS